MMTRFRQLLTVLLITFAVCGVQVVQASPLHDHSTHVVDCALCHFDANDQGVPATAAATWQPASGKNPVAAVDQSLPVTSPSPFQGRAPPRLPL